MNQDYVSSSMDSGVTLSQHMTRSFLWMAGGLAVTALVSFVVLYSGLWITIFSVPYSPFILLIAQLGVVIYLSGKLAKMKPATAQMLFMAYAVLTGVNFSILPIAYGLSNIFIAFGFTAVLFVCLAVIGLTTRKDLSGLGPMLLAGLITMILVSVVGYFINLGTFEMVINYIMIGIFLGLIAYDVQKMRALYFACEGDSAMLSKISIYSAFDLYLDFINIFLYILRILGRNSRN